MLLRLVKLFSVLHFLPFIHHSNNIFKNLKRSLTRKYLLKKFRIPLWFSTSRLNYTKAN